MGIVGTQTKEMKDAKCRPHHHRLSQAFGLRVLSLCRNPVSPTNHTLSPHPVTRESIEILPRGSRGFLPSRISLGSALSLVRSIRRKGVFRKDDLACLPVGRMCLLFQRPGGTI